MGHLHEKICVIKSILALYPNGTTFDTISDDYAELVGEQLGYTLADFYGIMCNMPTISIARDFYGNIHWKSKCPKTSHIRKMVEHQKNPHRRRKSTTIRPCNFDLPPRKYARRHAPYRIESRATRGAPNSMRDNMPTSTTNETEVNYDNPQDPFNPHLYEYQIIGDDFFLALAKLELGFLEIPGLKIHQSGLCISGQTIKGAIEHLERLPRSAMAKKIIINLGTVDLLHGRDVLDIKSDYQMLLNKLREMGIQPIVTTLPPIANHSYHSSIKPNWEKFNIFLRRQCNCIDIASRMMQNTRTLFSCYQGEAKYVSGSNRPHVLWNKIGRQRILKAMKAYLSENLC